MHARDAGGRDHEGEAREEKQQRRRQARRVERAGADLVEGADPVDRLLGPDRMDGRAHRALEPPGIAVRAEEERPETGELADRQEDLVERRVGDRVLPHVAHDAHDRDPRVLVLVGLDLDPLADRILARPDVPGHVVVDDRDHRRFVPVGVGEGAAPQHGHADRREVVGADALEVGLRLLLGARTPGAPRCRTGRWTGPASFKGKVPASASERTPGSCARRSSSWSWNASRCSRVA